MASTSTTARLLDHLRRHGVVRARELAAALGVSQPSVSRALREAGAQVVRIGRARRTRYAAVRDVRGLGARWPLYRVDERGRAHAFGDLTALHGGGCLLTAGSAHDWLRGEFVDGWFPGLPWFLDDMRPQGFLGRRFAHRYANELGLPEDVLRWGDDAVLAALLMRGDDAAGNFVLGDFALQRVLDAHHEVVDEATRADRYGALAQAALAGQLSGSSAAGEQPKFTACVADAAGTLRHVIVKFSEPVDASPAARRWADLLLCEHYAGVLLAAHGDTSALTQLVWSHGRLCLEATRFDRTGARGRRGVVTLAAWSDAHDGMRDNWADAATRMHAAGWIDAAALAQVRLRWWFGRLIGNTDMHFGNLAFLPGSALPLGLAPGYDMLPMRYRPADSGVMYQQVLDPPSPLPADQEVWQAAALLARAFWSQMADHDVLSAGFRRLAAGNAEAIAVAQRRFG